MKGSLLLTDYLVRGMRLNSQYGLYQRGGNLRGTFPLVQIADVGVILNDIERWQLIERNGQHVFAASVAGTALELFKRRIQSLFDKRFHQIDERQFGSRNRRVCRMGSLLHWCRHSRCLKLRRYQRRFGR